MRIFEQYSNKKPVVSLEVFPPKKDADIETVTKALSSIAPLNPDFISVTCGAGGSGGSEHTRNIAADVQKTYGVPAMAHITCIHADKRRMAEDLNELHVLGIENVLALRGDMPKDPSLIRRDYVHARELIADISARGDFCIAAACYPEGHIECFDDGLDATHLKIKQESGADFFISQLFFDNDLFYRFLERAKRAGVTKPISAGVMPILSQGQIERMIFLCGASLPSSVIKMLHKYESNAEDLLSAGIEHANDQIRDLIGHGVDGVHIYSMNKPAVAASCMQAAGR